MTKYIIFVSFIIFTTEGFSQNILGTVKSDSSEVYGARLSLKKGNSTLAFTFSDTEGNFIFHNVQQDSLEIEVAHLNFETQTIFLAHPTNVQIKFELVSKAIPMREVVVDADVQIRHKLDTIVYSLKHFTDGTEKIVEDILKKLPGITVNNDGKIFFKDKEIESLMIDGDDLFNSRYTIGSKNLSADDVESVEAIENFNRNKILHKITDTNNVAINLKLKKGTPAITIRADLENDFYSKYDNSLTTLVVHSKFKGFSVSEINNVGNSVKLDYIKIDGGITNSSNVALISEGFFPQFFGEKNSLLNNAFATSNSYKVKINKHTSSTTGINYYNDRIFQYIENESRYVFGDEDFTVFNADRQVSKPKVFSITNDLEYYNNADVQINCNLIFEKRTSNYVNNASIDNVLKTSSIAGELPIFAGKASLTKLLSNQSALSFYTFFSHDDASQNLLLSPSINLNDSLSVDSQTTKTTTDLFAAQAQYYRNWKNIKLKLTNTTEKKSNKMLSLLIDEHSAAESYANNLKLESFINHSEAQINFSNKKFKLGIVPVVWYSHSTVANQELNNFQLLFQGVVKYAVKKKHSLEFNFFQHLETPPIQYLYNRPILTSYREISQNEGKIDNIKRTESSLNYIVSDLYNTFYFKGSVSYSHKNKDYYYSTEISPQLILTKSFLLDQGNDRTSFSLWVHKFIPGIKINVKNNATYAISTFYNYVGDSPLRKIRNRNFVNQLTLYTSIGPKLNLNNRVNIEMNIFKDSVRQNTLTLVKNEFKVIYKASKNFNINSSIQTFVPDTKKNKRYDFLTFEALYDITEIGCEISLSAQNLLNNKNFRDVSISDYALYSYSYKLQERTILIGLRFKIF